MQVISSNEPVFADGKHGTICYRPFCRYIVSNYEAMYLMELARTTKWSRSSFNPYERRYGGQDLNGKRLCVYRHTAYGDQLMISAVPYYIKTIYPECILHLYCDPGIADMWRNNWTVGGAAIPIPIPFDVARSYDYHAFYEGMLENNGETDQNNCYDDFFGVLGLKDVPDQFKRPHIVVRPDDGKYVLRSGLDLSGKYMVFHLAPANRNRCYPPDKGMRFIKMFLEEYDLWRVLIVGKTGDDEWKKQFMEQVPDHPNVVNLVDKTPSFRHLIPIIERASLVVCPDSSVMHLAACFPEVPTISLWGLFHPNDRVKYYINNHPLYKFSVCPHAPCRNHEFTLPLKQCTQSYTWKDGQQYCAALNAIEPEDIMNKTDELLD